MLAASLLQKFDQQKERTYHFMDWVDGDFVDEMIVEINRKTAISFMKQKYPTHVFAYVCELSYYVY